MLPLPTPNPKKEPRDHEFLNGLKTVALFEAAKGAIVLLAGCGAFALLHRDAQHAAERLVREFHLNPANQHPRIFLHFAEQVTPAQIWLLAFGALCYALIRFIESYGLWRQRPWAKGLALVSGGVYLPIEVWELFKGITWTRVSLFTINLFVVAYLIWTLVRRPRG